MNPALQGKTIAWLIVMLAGLTALAPLAIDAYLPAMPLMASQLNTDIHAVEFSLSVFLAGFALGQIIGGPCSDRFGRRKVIFTGISLFILGSIAIIFSQTIEKIWVWRVLQAFGGGLAIVNSAAVIRDISSGRDSARHLSQMTMIMMAAPLLAPLIGLILLYLSGWRAIFVFLALYALLIGLYFYRYLPETRVMDPSKPSAFKRYGQILCHRRAIGYLFAICFTFGGLFSFITASPSVYMGYFAVSPAVYPLLFGVNVIVMIGFNRLNVFLLRQYFPAQLLTLGQILQSGVGLVLLAYVLLIATPQLWPLVLGIMLFIGFQGLIVSNAIASTIEFFPGSSATATALLGACGFLTGAASGLLVTSLSDGSPVAMIAVMSGCALSGLLIKSLVHHHWTRQAT